MSSKPLLKLVGRVDPLPSGRHRFRTEIGGKTRSETFDTNEEALSYQLEVSRELALRGPRPRHRMTVAEYGTGWLARRREDGEVRDIDGEERRWLTHIAETELGRSALTDADLTPSVVKEWFRSECARPIKYPYPHRRNGQPVSRGTVKKALVILRLCLDEAVLDGLIRSNPARAFRLRRRAEARTHDPWTYLEMHEQGPLLEGAPDELHDLITYALYVGPRQGEQWNQELCDVRDDGVTIRYGSRGKATKGGKVRQVPFFGPVKEAVKRQLKRLEGRPNQHGLLWPTPGGARRGRGKMPKGWFALRDALLAPDKRHDQRPVRWQDLRHTCASSLVAGWWGRVWTLQEVRDLLGHSSVTVTERYAHLAPSALQAAAKGTGRGPVGSGGAPPASPAPDEGSGSTPSRRRHDSEIPEDIAQSAALLTRRSRVRVPFDPPNHSDNLAAVALGGRDGVVTASEAALAFALAAAEDSPATAERARELAEAVLDSGGVKLALDILDGDPRWAAKALRLARLVLADDDAAQQAGGAS